MEKQTTQQIEPSMQEKKPKKKSKWWIWLIIAIILIVLGVAVWFFFFSGVENGATTSIQNFVKQATAPKPPALPD